MKTALMLTVRVRFQIIRNARIDNVGKSQSCMISKLRIIWKQTVQKCGSGSSSNSSSRSNSGDGDGDDGGGGGKALIRICPFAHTMRAWR